MEEKVLFVHDGPLYLQKNSYYSISYSNSLIERYRTFGESVSFLMRSGPLVGDVKNYNEISSPAFRFIRIPNFKSIRTYPNKRIVKKIIREEVRDHDVILIRLPSAAGTIAFRYAEKFRKPVLIEFVACVYDALWNYGLTGKLLAHYKYQSYRRLMKRAKHTIYVTEEFLQSRYPTPGKSVGCSDVVLKHLDEQILDKRVHKIRSSSAGSVVLGTVAALNVPYKRQADVIKAIAVLKGEGRLFQYKLVGRGDPLRLKKLARDLDVDELVDIVGPLSHEDVFRFLDEIDLYIQPSKQEGLPRAVIEAMSRACPLLGSTAGGIPELIADECLFQAGNVQEICRLLRKTDDQFLAKQAQLNFNKAQSYGKERLDKVREDFYRVFKSDYGLV